MKDKPTAEDFWHKHNGTKPNSKLMLNSHHRHVIEAMEQYKNDCLEEIIKEIDGIYELERATNNNAHIFATCIEIKESIKNKLSK